MPHGPNQICVVSRTEQLLELLAMALHSHAAMQLQLCKVGGDSYGGGSHEVTMTLALPSFCIMRHHALLSATAYRIRTRRRARARTSRHCPDRAAETWQMVAALEHSASDTQALEALEAC